MYLEPQNIPRAIIVLTLGNKVVLYVLLLLSVALCVCVWGGGGGHLASSVSHRTWEEAVAYVLLLFPVLLAVVWR